MDRAPTPPARPAITPSDAAVQIVESAHQIVTMIGANPRAIRPILAQRRLTKDTILAAATSVERRATAALAEMDAPVEGGPPPTAQYAYLSALRERATKVAEVYQAL